MTASCAWSVRAKTADRIETEVLVGGELSSRKGVSLPDTVLPFSPLTEKDRENLEYAANLGVDWIALSFVQRAEDVVEAKQLIDGRAAVMSKIEKPSAVVDIERIMAEVRRHHGGARRSRRRAAAAAGARRAEAADAAGAPARQAGRRRDADAGIDDQRARADPRRGLRRRHRRLSKAPTR